MHLIQEIGSYAGFGAVVGLAILSALYFSQARDVKRLREWAGRAPERAAEAEAGGRVGAIAASRAGAQPRATPAHASPAAAPAQQAAPAAAKQPGQTPEPAQTPAPAASPVPAASPAARGPAVATAAAGGVATATPETGAAPSRSEPEQEPDHAGNSGNTSTGAKVLPPRPSGPPRPAFTRSPAQGRDLGNTAMMPAPLAGGRDRRVPPPRYLVLIVVGLIILGVGAAVGVIALTNNGSSTNSSTQSASVGNKAGKHHKKKHKNFPPAIDPSTVTVAVLNGTSVPGLAAKEGGKIQSSGFKLGNVTNAARAAAGQRAESVVMFKPGENRKARAVARKLGVSQIEPVDAQTSTLSGAASVVVVVGADQIGH